MSQVWVVAGSGTVDLILLLVLEEVVGLGSLSTVDSWLVGAAMVAVFFVTMVAWLYSPIPNGTTFGGTYGTGWGFGSEEGGSE